jgi:DNA-directed RNA polymerase subunit RPC12/RpoP
MIIFQGIGCGNHHVRCGRIQHSIQKGGKINLRSIVFPKDSDTMQSFKFICPDCGAHIEDEPSSVGCLIECPQCSEELVVPAYNPSAMSMPIAKHSRHFPAHARHEEQANADTRQAPPSKHEKAVSSTSLNYVEQDVPAVPDHEGKVAHVGVLTPAVKLDVVRWAFRRIENSAVWLPHERNGHHYIYAQRRNANGYEPVSYDHPEARRYSLLGAVLLELKIQHASVTAEGREAFLDHEIVAAAEKVLAEVSEKVGEGEDPLSKLDHAQTLSVLRLLESKYLADCEHLDDLVESARIPGVTMTELIRRAEKGGLVTSNEVLSVLYHEVHLLNRRVEELEDVIKTRSLQ